MPSSIDFVNPGQAIGARFNQGTHIISMAWIVPKFLPIA